MYTYVNFTPRELFDNVWETPVLKLAQEIGISDVALSKACRKAGIALPTRGHWAKPIARRPKKPKPPASEETISFRVQDRATLALRRPTPFQAQIARSPLVVPRTLFAPHPLVSQWIKCVKAAKLQDGYLVTSGKAVLDIKITGGLIDRCALIFDTLIKESELLGYRWKVESDGSTYVAVDSERLAIRCVERLSKNEIPSPPPHAPKRNARWEPDFSFLRSPQFEWSSTGELSLQIAAHTEYGLQKKWADTKTGQIEEKLTRFLHRLAVIAESVKALRLKNEEDDRLYKAKQAAQLERTKCEETRRRLRHTLSVNTTRWEQAQRLKAFIQATCNAAAGHPEHTQQQTALWAAWATAQANLLDPLSDPISATSLTVEIESWFSAYGIRAGKDWWSE